MDMGVYLTNLGSYPVMCRRISRCQTIEGKLPFWTALAAISRQLWQAHTSTVMLRAAIDIPVPVKTEDKLQDRHTTHIRVEANFYNNSKHNDLMRLTSVFQNMMFGGCVRGVFAKGGPED
eukprot:3919666-Amphidinium_carterae.1